MHTKKSQAAMEFLMTYGWALIVVLIAIASLAFFGILSPDRFLSDKAEFGTGLVVDAVAYQAERGAIALIVRNGLGKNIEDLQITIDECNMGAGATSTAINISEAESKLISITCSNLTANSFLKSDMTAAYSVSQKGATLSGSLEGFIRLEITSVLDFTPFTACDSGDAFTTCTISSYTFTSGEYIGGTGTLIISGTLSNTAALSELTLDFPNVQITGTVTAGSVTIDSTTVSISGSINANEKGNAAATGSGAGQTDSNGEGGGAGYGGAGGRGGACCGGGAGGSTYGSGSAPTDFGSGGGNSEYGGTATGGSGGGRVRIDATTVTVDGTISVNGGDGGATAQQYVAAGGGSGGSVYITTDTFAGSGTISADGGDGGQPWIHHGGGGGGGGRIVVDYDSSTWSGSTSVSGGVGPGAAVEGSDGTATLS